MKNGKLEIKKTEANKNKKQKDVFFCKNISLFVLIEK